MHMTLRRRLSRLGVVVAALAALLLPLALMTAWGTAQTRARTTVLVLAPPWSGDDATVRDYLAFLLVEYLREAGGLVAGRGEDEGLRVLSSSAGAGAFEVELRTSGPEAARRILLELVATATRRLTLEVRTLILGRTQILERELSVLERSRRFEESLGEGARSVMAAREEQLRVELQRLRLYLAEPPEIVRSAEPLTSLVPTEGAPGRMALLAFVGLTLVFAGLELFLHVNGRRRARWFVERGTELPVLAVIPPLEDPLPVRSQPFGPAAEAFRSLRTRLACAGARRVVLVGVEAGEGTSTVAANLALVDAETGRRTLLVDGDMRRPRQHVLFGVGNDVGLTDVLIDTETRDAIWDAPDAGLGLLTSGPTPPDPGALLEGERLVGVLGDPAGLGVASIVVDAPPLSGCSDALPLAVAADALVVVVRPGVADPERVVAAVRELARAGAPLAGLVFTDVALGGGTRVAYGVR